MANHMKGEVEVEAGDKKLIFRLGVNEMVAAQDALGLANDDQGFLEALDNLRGLGPIRIIVHNGLKRDQPDFTVEMAGDLITELGLERTTEIIQEAMRWALPAKEATDVQKKGGRPRPSVGPTPS